MITVQNFTRDANFLTLPFGYLTIQDIDTPKQSNTYSMNSALSYNDGGSIFARIRSRLYFNFTSEFKKDVSSDLMFNVVGVDPST